MNSILLFLVITIILLLIFYVYTYYNSSGPDKQFIYNWENSFITMEIEFYTPVMTKYNEIVKD